MFWKVCRSFPIRTQRSFNATPLLYPRFEELISCLVFFHRTRKPHNLSTVLWYLTPGCSKCNIFVCSWFAFDIIWWHRSKRCENDIVSYDSHIFIFSKFACTLISLTEAADHAVNLNDVSLWVCKIWVEHGITNDQLIFRIVLHAYIIRARREAPRPFKVADIWK